MTSEFGWQFMKRFFSNINLLQISNTFIKHNFLSFLATAQTLEIEFLPITWQSTRQKIEKSDIFKIHEVSANIRMSFAFKRIKDDEKSKNIETIFQMFKNEIIVLNHSSIQKHSNIVKLQNICWDIFDDKIWSILMFEKFQFDDLYSFATRSVEKKLNIYHRFKLCVEIENVITYMHFHDK